MAGETRWAEDEETEWVEMMNNTEDEWEFFTDEEGNDYWHNEKTGESRWHEEELPTIQL